MFTMSPLERRAAEDFRTDLIADMFRGRASIEEVNEISAYLDTNTQPF